jgi:hypothetical protein
MQLQDCRPLLLIIKPLGFTESYTHPFTIELADAVAEP